jgi:hypothetical protein
MTSFRFSVLTCLLLLLFTLCAAAQESGTASTTGNPRMLPADTAIVAKLVGKFDSKDLQKGDRVEARITHDVRTAIKRLSRRARLLPAW